MKKILIYNAVGMKNVPTIGGVMMNVIEGKEIDKIRKQILTIFSKENIEVEIDIEDKRNSYDDYDYIVVMESAKISWNNKQKENKVNTNVVYINKGKVIKKDFI